MGGLIISTEVKWCRKEEALIWKKMINFFCVLINLVAFEDDHQAVRKVGLKLLKTAWALCELWVFDQMYFYSWNWHLFYCAELITRCLRKWIMLGWPKVPPVSPRIALEGQALLFFKKFSFYFLYSPNSNETEKWLTYYCPSLEHKGHKKSCEH